MQMATCVVGGIVARVAESSSGPLENNHTGRWRSAARCRSTSLRAAGCQRFA